MKRNLLTVLVALVAATVLSACGGDTSPGDLAGTWKVDGAALKKEFLASETAKQIPEAMRGGIADAIGASDYTVAIKADGTWTSSGKMGQNDQNEKGTWKLDGNKITVTVTHEDGKEIKDGDVYEGTVDGDVITAKSKKQADAPAVRLLRQ